MQQRTWRRPYPVLIAWTVAALLPMTVLLVIMSAPVAAGCFEYCTFGQEFAALGFRLVAMVWLLAVLIVAWDWQVREPTVAAVSAGVAGLLLVVVAIRVYGVVSFDAISEDVIFTAWVLSLGLQLPPIWRLATRNPPSMPMRLIVGAMGALVALGAFAIVLLGANQGRDAGPNVVFVAWIAIVVGLIVVAFAALRHGGAKRSIAGALLAASLPIALLPIGLAAPGSIAYAIFLPIPLSTIAWAWTAFAWLRGASPGEGD